MTDTMEVEMESAATNEAHGDTSNKEEQDESGAHKPKSRIYPGEIIEGKREKKTVQRLNMQMGKPKEKLKVESIGHGDKLGDIARVNHAIGKLKAPQLKPLHKIIYDRPGAVSSLRKHLRLFNGFPFEMDSDPYNKKKEKVLKLPKIQLRTICQILDLERSGTQSVLGDRIMQFLTNPTNSGKPVILKKKKKKKTPKDAKREKKTTSKSKHQQVESGKSKAIVTDSSSDEAEDDDDDDDRSKNEDGEKSDGHKHEGDESISEEEEVKNIESDEGSEDDKEKETSKSKKPSSKKKLPTKKEPKKADDSDQVVSDEDDESPEDTPPKKAKRKPASQKKVKAMPTPKTKKADSSSTMKKNASSKTKLKIESSDDDDDDDDDEPLIKMIKKPPSDEQLKSAVKDLLKDANLAEVTMKQICQQVYDIYPDFDLTARKNFIKDTVKSLIS